MYLKKRAIAAFCAALTMNSASSLIAFADSPDHDSACTLSDAAYQMLLDHGYSADEIAERLSETRSIGIYDWAYSVNCIQAPPSYGFVKVNVTYDSSLVSDFGIVSGTITGTSYSGSSATAYTQDLFTSLGRIMTYHFSRNSTATALTSAITDPGSITQLIIDGVSVSSGYISIDGYANFIPLGDVSPDGNIDISDYIATVNYLAGSGTPSINRPAIDVNSDGSEDLTDANLIYDYICHVNAHVWG